MEKEELDDMLAPLKQKLQLIIEGKITDLAVIHATLQDCKQPMRLIRAVGCELSHLESEAIVSVLGYKCDARTANAFCRRLKRAASVVATSQSETARVGMTVRLISGGPDMTIESIDGREVHCAWFRDYAPPQGEPVYGKVERDVFDIGVLNVAADEAIG